jgi:hypothetical protein
MDASRRTADHRRHPYARHCSSNLSDSLVEMANDSIHLTDNGQPGSYQFTGRISTDKRIILTGLTNFRVIGKQEAIVRCARAKSSILRIAKTLVAG